MRRTLKDLKELEGKIIQSVDNLEIRFTDGSRLEFWVETGYISGFDGSWPMAMYGDEEIEL